MKAHVYNQAGKQTTDVSLPEEVFALPWNGDLVHQVVIAMQANRRAPIAHTKDRSEVRGGGKKPWRQKGTGRARHGSSRSPIWRGGGVTFGPTNERNFSQKVNKKMRKKALQVVLAQKFRDGELLFVDKIAMSEAKTKEAHQMVVSLAANQGAEKLATKKKNTAFIGFDRENRLGEKSFRNLPGFKPGVAVEINLLDCLENTYIIVENPEAFIEAIK